MHQAIMGSNGWLHAGLMAEEANVQVSATFKNNGHKLLRKAQQLLQRTGEHALATIADSKHTCNMYASNVLQLLAGDQSAKLFICDQLVCRQHPGQYGSISQS